MRKVFKASPAYDGRSRASRTDRVKSKLLRPPVTLQLRAGDHVAFPSLGPTYKGSNATAKQTDLTNPSPMAEGAGRSHCDREARRLGRSEHVKPHMQVAAGGLVTFTFT